MATNRKQSPSLVKLINKVNKKRKRKRRCKRHLINKNYK